jgi:mono/diheme cytochrome c family protein
MKRISFSILAFAALALGGAGLAVAADKKKSESPDLGKREYLNSCAACHGASGKLTSGEGAGVEFLKTTPPDLTTLSKKNGGVFPYERVIMVIDGRKLVSGHGSRDMPIWGDRYTREGVKAAEYYVDMPYDMEMYARARMHALIDYIHRLQAK